VPGVNNLAAYGRWAFIELTDPYLIESEFAAAVQRALDAATEAKPQGVN